MARTTTRTPQAHKNGLNGCVFNGNAQKRWRKTHSRDRNVGNRGYDPYHDERGYDRRYIGKLAKQYLLENLAEAGLATLPQYNDTNYFEDHFYQIWDDVGEQIADRLDQLWEERLDERWPFDYRDVRSCGCIGRECNYDHLWGDFDYDFAADYIHYYVA